MILVRILRRLLTAEFIGLLLILIALQALTSGISFSLRNTDSRYFYWTCLIAALIAFGLNKLNLNGVQASLGMIALGLACVWILAAGLASPLLALSRAILSVAPELLPAIRSGDPIDARVIGEAWLVVAGASNALSARVLTWLRSLDGAAVTVNDPLVRNMAWALILWLISAWLGWFASRRQAVAALLPSITLLALITSYSELRVETVWLMVFILLLLMGIWNYKNHTMQWERRKVDYSDSILYDVSQAVVLLSVVIGLVAFITPSISWRQIREFLRTRHTNELAETLGVQQQQVPVQPVSGPKPALPREHWLHGGFAQSPEIVMTVRTGELPPVASPLFADQAARYYWRSTMYDTYAGAGWLTSTAVAQRYDANTPLIPGLLNGYRTLHLNVEMAQPEGKLFWSGILFSADVPIRADWRTRPSSNLFADQSALLQADLFMAASPATTYRAEAYVPLVTVEELRAAPTDYSEMIRERYLKLPASVPERVRQLADEITQDKTTAYDKAKAIEAYLRSYPYDLEVPSPPTDQDVADYFLFDLKKGYCDYYATAMVVLARASGIPARFVAGYASGSYDAANARYVVRELNAHSWAEIYFPGIGWVEFEPTAAQPEIEFPLSNDEITHTPPDATAIRLLNRFRLASLLYLLLPFGIVIFSFLLYFAWIENWLYMRLSPEIAVEKIYRRLYRLGRPLAGEWTKAETVSEFTKKLTEALDFLREHSRYAKHLNHVSHDVKYLCDMYQETLFADHAMEKQDVRNIIFTWKHLRLRLLLARVQMAANASWGKMLSRIRAIGGMLRASRST